MLQKVLLRAALVLCCLLMIVGRQAVADDANLFMATYSSAKFNSNSCTKLHAVNDVAPKYLIEKKGYFRIKFEANGLSSLRIEDNRSLWSEILNALLAGVGVTEARTITLSTEVMVGAEKILILPIFTVTKNDDDDVTLYPHADVRDFSAWISTDFSAPVKLRYLIRYSKDVNSNIVQTVQKVATQALALAGGAIGGGGVALAVNAGSALLKEKAKDWDNELKVVLSKDQAWKAGEAVEILGASLSSACSDYVEAVQLKVEGSILPNDIISTLKFEYSPSKLSPNVVTSEGLPDLSQGLASDYKSAAINLPPKARPSSFYRDEPWYPSFIRANEDQAGSFGAACKTMVKRLREVADLSYYDSLGVLYSELLDHVGWRSSQKLRESDCLSSGYSDSLTKINLTFRTLSVSPISRDEQVTQRNAVMDAFAGAIKSERFAGMKTFLDLMVEDATLFDETDLTPEYEGPKNKYVVASLLSGFEVEHFACYYSPKSQHDILRRSAFLAQKGSDETYYVDVAFGILEAGGKKVVKIIGVTIRPGSKKLAKRTLVSTLGAIQSGETANKYNDCVFYQKRDKYKVFDVAFQ